jgi:endonuclease/exonuclease/phosphatase family metal-dependent hydrolase
MRLLTYNIHHFEGLDGRFDFDRFERVFRSVGADLIGLNEVFHPLYRAQQGEERPLERWAQRLGFSFVFGQNLRVEGKPLGGAYGNALLSRYPIRRWTNHPLPREPRGPRERIEPRGLLEAEVETESHRLTVFVTHLHHGEPEALRVAQMETILEHLRACPHPHLLMGDLNDLSPADPDSPPERTEAIALLLRAGYVDAFQQAGTGPSGTIPVPEASRRIDFIFLSPDLAPSLRSAAVWRHPLTEVASDHYPVMAECEP